MSDIESLEVPAVLSDDSLELPSYAHAGDGGLDLRAAESIVLAPFERALISTGLSVAIPDGYAGFVLPRSGLAIKQGLSVVNAPGLIDSNYRGEIKVIAINLDAKNEISIAKGDRIAQLVVQKVEHVVLSAVDSLDDTQRGAGGFGSSGTK